MNTKLSVRKIALLRRLPTLRFKGVSYPPVSAEDRNLYPEFAADFAVLDAELMPTFTKYDVDALKNQNRYRRQKTLVLFGAATLSGLGGLQAIFPGTRWPGIALVLIGIALASSAQVSQESDRLKSYLTSRTKAERLRAVYFMYLSRTGPFAAEGAGHLRTLRRSVLAIENGKEIE